MHTDTQTHKSKNSISGSFTTFMVHLADIKINYYSILNLAQEFHYRQAQLSNYPIMGSVIQGGPKK